MDYHIYHMFPKLLNLYGDRGNIMTLVYFAKELGLNPIIHEIDDVKDIDWDHMDFMLIGGGSDREQGIVTSYLQLIKDKIQNKLDHGLPILAVCGGYQFLGNHYQDAHGNIIECLGLLDFHTIAQEKTRLIENTVIESPVFGKLVGFVNHGGETFHDYQTLGKVLVGFGNNLEAKDEGIIYKNLIGTYLHGPLLPKNPELTCYFLRLFCEAKDIPFEKDRLDFTMEHKASSQLIEKYLK